MAAKVARKSSESVDIFSAHTYKCICVYISIYAYLHIYFFNIHMYMFILLHVFFFFDLFFKQLLLSPLSFSLFSSLPQIFFYFSLAAPATSRSSPWPLTCKIFFYLFICFIFFRFFNPSIKVGMPPHQSNNTRVFIVLYLYGEFKLFSHFT